MEQTLMEYPLLDKRILAKYDLIKTEENILETMDRFLQLQYKNTKIEPPRLTPGYEVRYEQRTIGNYSDSTGNFVADKIDTENEIESFYNKLGEILLRMNKHERMYYAEHLINRNSERFTADIIGTSTTGLQPIKYSCLIKLAIGFGQAVEL